MQLFCVSCKNRGFWLWSTKSGHLVFGHPSKVFRINQLITFQSGTILAERHANVPAAVEALKKWDARRGNLGDGACCISPPKHFKNIGSNMCIWCISGEILICGGPMCPPWKIFANIQGGPARWRRFGIWVYSLIGRIIFAIFLLPIMNPPCFTICVWRNTGVPKELWKCFA